MGAGAGVRPTAANAPLAELNERLNALVLFFFCDFCFFVTFPPLIVMPGETAEGMTKPRIAQQHSRDRR